MFAKKKNKKSPGSICHCFITVVYFTFPICHLGIASRKLMTPASMASIHSSPVSFKKINGLTWKDLSDFSWQIYDVKFQTPKKVLGIQQALSISHLRRSSWSLAMLTLLSSFGYAKEQGKKRWWSFAAMSWVSRIWMFFFTISKIKVYYINYIYTIIINYIIYILYCQYIYTFWYPQTVLQFTKHPHSSSGHLCYIDTWSTTICSKGHGCLGYWHIKRGC